MNKFRIEYEKMVKAVRASRQNLQKYSHQEAAFEKELKAFNESSHDAVKSSKHDYMSIETLKSTIANIQENLNASMAREDTCKEQLRTLRTEISALTMTVKQGVGLSSVQEKTLQELHQAKDLAQKELEGELDKIILLRARILEIADKIKQTDEYKMKLEADIFDSKEKNTLKKGDIEGEIRNKERLEKELRDIRAIVAQKSQEIKIKQDTMQRISGTNN